MSADIIEVGGDHPDRPAPLHDPDAERSVLGSVLLQPAARDDILAARLRGDDFHAPRHETIWQAIGVLADRGEGIDPITVAAQLASTGDLSRIGGPAYLHTLISEVATPANAGYYARTVVEYANRRRLMMAGQRVVQMGQAAEGGATVDLIAHAEKLLAEVAARASGSPVTSIGDAFDETVDALESGLDLTPTRLPDMNNLIPGWAPGHLVIVGARPSVGKSVLMEHAALELVTSGLPTVFASLEMTRTEFILRGVSSLGRVDHHRFRETTTRPLTDGEWDTVAACRAKLEATAPNGAPLLLLSDTDTVTVQGIGLLIREHTKAHGRPPAAVFVDYLQLLRPAERRNNRTEEVSAMTRDLKLLAKKTGTCIVAGSQLNRDGNDAPKLTNLRESGSIEQDADEVILMHRAIKEEDGDPTDLSLIVAKCRHGRTGTVKCVFRGHYQRIDASTRQDAGRHW